ncbi:Protein air1 [Leucoagaricus sp. SymC.cos]|nr:Protein air1 [Leucoagaricus sp. SymC.cos]
MPDTEIIDLTNSPTLPAVLGSQDLPAELLTANPAPNGEKKKRQRKRKRKRSQKLGAQSQDTTAVTTRSNSEEEGEESEDEGPQDARHVRQKRGPANATTENDASSSSIQDRLSSGKKIKQKEDTSSSVPVATGNTNLGDLFFEDITPVPLPPATGNPPPPVHGIINLLHQNTDDTKLLLPAHVTFLGSTPVEILPPTESDEEGDTDYIKYLDYGGDHQKEFLRYFEEPEDESLKLKRTVCKNCGAEGDHKTADCRVLICLTCGVRDEHVTKSCPVSKVCFSCGMKGHIISNCPNRHMRTRDHGNNSYCNRCYSEIHQTSECPTWWRLYVYVTDEDRSRILNGRRSKRVLELGKGGEGYIAEDEWCYNCGEVGHWGDDCKAAHRFNKPEEPSAFGLHNISTGPFYDPDTASTSSKPERRLREWEREDHTWSMHGPVDVGKQGRKKTMERMRKSAQKFEEESDPDDWFGNPRNVRNRGAPTPTSYSRSDRDWDRRRDRDRERQRDRDREIERQRNRERDWERDRDWRREQDRERERDYWERDKERDRTRDREWGREQQRRPERDEGGSRDQASSGGKGGGVKITFSNSIGRGRNFLPPSLPARPSTDSRPRLLDRISEDTNPRSYPGNTLPRVNNSNSLSIRGAGRRQGRDDDRNNYRAGREQPGPRYQGGYGR